MTPASVLYKVGAVGLISILGVNPCQQNFPFATAVAQEAGVTISSRTELVTVPVVVTDKKGKHLTGLKKSDFVIEEDGHKREIATFQEIITSDQPRKPVSLPPFPLSNFAFSGQQQSLVTILV